MTDPNIPATDPPDPPDPPDLLLERLRRIATDVDDPPELVLATARAALLTRQLDAELAELVMDSAVDELAAVRDAGGDVRLLSFEASTVSMELQVSESGAARVLHGLVRGHSGEVVVESAAQTQLLTVDPHGWFSVELPQGTVRLHLHDETGAAVTTSWVSI